MVSKDVDVMLHGAMIPLSMDTLVLNSIKRREEKKKEEITHHSKQEDKSRTHGLSFFFFFCLRNCITCWVCCRRSAPKAAAAAAASLFTALSMMYFARYPCFFFFFKLPLRSVSYVRCGASSGKGRKKHRDVWHETTARHLLVFLIMQQVKRNTVSSFSFTTFLFPLTSLLHLHSFACFHCFQKQPAWRFAPLLLRFFFFFLTQRATQKREKGRGFFHFKLCELARHPT